MLLADGTVMTRAEIVRSLGQVPPRASFDIDDPELWTVGDDVVTLVDTGTGDRDGGDSFTAVMTGVSVDAWSRLELTHDQQTPIGRTGRVTDRSPTTGSSAVDGAGR